MVRRRGEPGVSTRVGNRPMTNSSPPRFPSRRIRTRQCGIRQIRSGIRRIHSGIHRLRIHRSRGIRLHRNRNRNG